MDRAQDQALRQLRALVGSPASDHAHGAFTLGAPDVDAALKGGLSHGAVHEIFTAGCQDVASAAGFAAALALRAGGGKAPCLWVRQIKEHAESGTLYGHGLAGFGLDPCLILHVAAKDTADALRAALEGLRCPGLGAVVLEIRGQSKILDHTAIRRLSLAAQDHGVMALVLRINARPVSSPALVRWQVAAAPSQSPGLNLPGPTAFAVTLLKHRFGQAGQTWHLEWDHETCRFSEKTLSRALAPLSFNRPDRADRGAQRPIRTRAG